MNRVISFAVALAIAMGHLQAQDKALPEAGSEEPEHIHVGQPAWKSTEVGDFYLRRKSYRAALSRYKEAVETDPYYPQAYLGLGKVYDRLGLRQKALENYQKYLDLLPSSKEAEEAREVHKAIARLKKKIQRSPSSGPRSASGESSSSAD